MIDSVSTPGWPRWPSTSTITPSPSRMCDGKRTMSITTLSSGCTPFAPGSPTKIGLLKTLPSICTMPHAGLLEIDADEAVGGPLDDVDDAAFELAHAAALFEPHGDDVAAGGVAASCPRG